MKYLELRKIFFDFFKEKAHQIIPSSPLITGDTSTLFTIAGMQPLIPYLLGKKHKKGNKLVNIQKCIRTEDIEEVGDKTHLTFFEMLGNWGLQNAYWKKDSINWSWEFLTYKKWLNLDKNKFAVSVFKGNENISFDEESYQIWKEIFEKEKISEKRIAKLEDNWWQLSEKEGLQGPDTEIFYWIGNKKVPEKFDSNDKNWVEVWNNVFMEYNKMSDEKLEKLDKKNIDTGMGLERILSILQNKEIFETEIFKPIIEKIEEISKKKYIENKREFRIISDHIKASVFILSERIEPSNTKQGYVLRRLIRRAIRYGNTIGIKEIFLNKLVDSVIEIYKEIYPELENEKQFIIEQLKKEEEKFPKTLEKALRMLRQSLNIENPMANFLPNIEISSYSTIKPSFDLPPIITGKFAFDFYQSFGFPIEMFLEEIEREIKEGKKIEYNKEKILKEFYEELEKHQELSRTSTKGMFKGGLKGETEIEKKYHTATHLLHFALRKILGNEIEQKGSNISPERLRFDFSYPEKLTEEQLKEIEDLVNEKIKEKIPVICQEMSLEKAKNSGAIGLFEEKYKDNISVYSIGDFSKEICGGPHIENIGKLGKFKIIKEESVSSGIRRIKAILE
jgi:alanyl-tRNA synthetase